jgi:transcriptional regulator with XRE-family HTH domain
MMTRNNLINSKEYWMAKIQMELFAEVEQYLSDNNMNRAQFAEKLGVSKGYVSQILNGDFNHSVSKLIELSLAIGKVPVINFENISKYTLETPNIPTEKLNIPAEKPMVKVKKRVAELV